MKSSQAIFMAFDESYSLYARACLNSLNEHYPKHPEIFVFYDGTEAATIDYLRLFPGVHLLPREALVDPGNVTLGPVGSKGVYYKYSTWSPFFAEFDKVLYLNVDTLILKPLDDLFAMETAYAAPNHEALPQVRVFAPESIAESHLQNLLRQDRVSNLGEMDDMCNAGVLMLPQRYRSSAQLQKLIDITARYNQFLNYADQSAISIWFHLNKLPLSARYEFNFQAPMLDAPDMKDYDLRNIGILHFSSPRKPNTVEFMMWGRIPLERRKEMAKLFMRYARLELPAHA